MVLMKLLVSIDYRIHMMQYAYEMPALLYSHKVLLKTYCIERNSTNNCVCKVLLAKKKFYLPRRWSHNIPKNSTFS